MLVEVLRKRLAGSTNKETIVDDIGLLSSSKVVSTTSSALAITIRATAINRRPRKLAEASNVPSVLLDPVEGVKAN